MNRMIFRPQISTYPSFIQYYMERSPENVLEALGQQKYSVCDYIDGLDDKDLDDKYAPGKWTIRQVLAHIIDSERLFAYRAFCLSRAEKQRLNNFDQDKYIENAQIDHWDRAYIKNDFGQLRQSTLSLFLGFSSQCLNNTGFMSDYSLETAAFPFIMYGHVDHHLEVLKSRYAH